MNWWKEYWFPSASLFDLAMARIIIVGCQLILLVCFYYYTVAHLHYLSTLPDSLYAPLPILQVMLWPLGSTYRPSFEMLTVVYYMTLGLGAGALLGFKTNYCLFAFTLSSIFLQAFSYSFKVWHHSEALMMLALLVLALSPSGRVLSIDNLWHQLRWNLRSGRVKVFKNIIDRSSVFARWPLMVLRWLFALIYLSAGLNKIGRAGLDWVNGYTLQYYLLRDGLWDSNLAVWLAHRPSLVWITSLATVVFEVTFFLILIFPKLAWLYIPAGVIFHIAIYVMMGAPFFQFIAIYAVFVPWGLLLQTWSHRLKFPHPAQNPEIVFDGRLATHRLVITALHYFDWLNRLRFSDLQTQWNRIAKSDPDISLEVCHRKMHVVFSDNSVRKGFRALSEVLCYLPPLWPLLVALNPPAFAAVVPRLYRSIVSKRGKLTAQ
jgi:DCC1-like thiol-disulfide oxidoreductase